MSMNYKNKDFVETLINQHSATLLRFLARRMKSVEDAEDIAQATFMRLYTLDDVGELSNAKAFLFQVAANLSIDQLRRKVLHQNYLEREGAKLPVDGLAAANMFADNIPLEREMEAKETLSFIYQALSDLPQNQRQAFILNRAKGMTYSEIAAQMGVSVSSVEKYILEALKHLRGALAQIEEPTKK
jgi:RNA polymerase sigma factor (sigma-70 family)